MIREATIQDLQGLMELYTHLHDNEMPVFSDKLTQLWAQIINDCSHHIIVAEEDGRILSSCVCVIIPNLTHYQQSYALIENVITHSGHRNKGFATACLDYAKEIAKRENCYKIMLLTGAKDRKTLDFYRKAGYNCNDKTAFIQWL